MRAAPLVICLWPGLAGLWLKGRWVGLLEALAFAVLLNASLAASSLGPERIGFTLFSVIWLVVAAAWCAGFWRNLRQLPELLAPSPAASSVVDLYPEAQAEYLKGHWFEAETLLARQLQSSPEDVECRLLLATLYRRTKRPEDAERQLRRLEQCETSYRWQFEIQQERVLLAGHPEHPSLDESEHAADPQHAEQSKHSPDEPHQPSARAA
jgi:hypothetical protein